MNPKQTASGAELPRRTRIVFSTEYNVQMAVTWPATVEDKALDQGPYLGHRRVAPGTIYD